MEHTIVLASASPQRREILGSLGIAFHVMPSHVDESLSPEMTPEQAVTELSKRKARAVAATLAERRLVIGADTVVAYAGRILGKPQDSADAFRTLAELRGSVHRVLTGVTVMDSGTKREETTVVATKVTMRAYSDEDVMAYVATGEPFDKAGSYAIQGRGASLVKEVEGPMDNVVGLPGSAVAGLLQRFGVPPGS